MQQSFVTPSLEDCLESIYFNITAKQGVRAVDISRDLNVSRPSVTEMLKKLAAKKLINYSPYGIISLTSEGEKLAREVLKKHVLLNSFFEDVLGLDKDEAKDNACKIEHIISDNALQRLIALTEFCQKFDKDFKEFYKKRSPKKKL